MAEAPPVTPSKPRSEDVELMFQKMGEKLGWFQHKDVNSAMKSLTKSTKKKSTKSRVRHESGDISNKENKSAREVAKGDKQKNRKHKVKPQAQSDSVDTDSVSNNRNEEFEGYPLKASKASTDLKQSRKKRDNMSETPLKEHKSPQQDERSVKKDCDLSPDYGDVVSDFPEMPSMLEDIGAPLVESTRIHSRESICQLQLNSFISNGSNDSLMDQSSANWKVKSDEHGHRYFNDKTLIRVRNSLSSNELRRRCDTSEKYFSVIGESFIGEEKEEYFSVLEESPLEGTAERSRIQPQENDSTDHAEDQCNNIEHTDKGIVEETKRRTQFESDSSDAENYKNLDSDKTQSRAQEKTSDVPETMKHRQGRELSSGHESLQSDTSGSSDSFYEVQDAVVQTENIDSENDEDLDKDSKMSNLCDQLQDLLKEKEPTKHLDVDSEENSECYVEESPKCGDSEHSLSGTSEQSSSEGSFYDVIDQCVQTEETPHTSSISQSNSMNTDISQSNAVTDTTSAKVSPYFQNGGKSKPLPATNSGTPSLAELQTATYERLRNSLKKFTPTATQRGGLMESVLKKVNLFGGTASQKRINPKHISDSVSDSAKEQKSDSCEESSRNSSNSDQEKNVDDATKAFSNISVAETSKMSSSDFDISGVKPLDASKSDNAMFRQNEKDKNTNQINEIDTKNAKNPNVEGISQKDFGESRVIDVAQTPSTYPLETFSRRNKLSLKKPKPKVKISTSSISSGASDGDLYKTGFSSPDYESENLVIPQTQECSNSQKGPERPDSSVENESTDCVTIPDSPPPENDNENRPQSNEDSLFSDDGGDGIPDSNSEEANEEFHSICVSKDTNSKNSESEDSNEGEITQVLNVKSAKLKSKPKFHDSDSEDSSQEEVTHVENEQTSRGREHKVKRKGVSWRKNTSDSDDSLPDLDTNPYKNERHCVTVADTSNWRSNRKLSESSEEEYLEAFFQKMKKPAKTKQIKSSSEDSESDGLDDFIVDDDEVESESEDDELFYLKTDNQRKTSPLRVPQYVTSSDDDLIEVSDEDEDFKPEFNRKPKKSTATETPLPKAAPRKYETPKAQIIKSSLPPSSSKSTTTKVYSFLRSLSADLADHRRHPDAVTYVKQFKKHKGELSQRLFILYNQTVFDNRLPGDLDISWNKRLLKTAGYCKYMRNHSAKVELSDKVCDSAERVRDTLIHELCHAASWVLNYKNDGHGPYWKYWARKSNLCHPEIPVISRCHNYAIATKYTYTCVGCGYSIGRHSKSLDTDRKVCGKCHGRFQVHLTKDTPSNSASATPKTPRTPNRFALFVKEKYGVYKREMKDLKHKEIMQLLSQEFAAKNKLTD